MTRIAFLFPGQGAQYVGMSRDFYEQFAISRQVFEEADDLLKTSFSSLIFAGTSEELALTKNCQLAIFIASIAIFRAFQQELPECVPSVCAGLSLGEYTALFAAEKISFAEGIRLVRARGEAMQQACEEVPSGMQVVLGLDEAAVREALTSFSSVWVANLNCPGQVVIAGKRSALEGAALHLKERGAKRVLPLDVAGAFHTPLMRSAQEKLEPFLLSLPLRESSCALIMNVPGDFVSSIDQMREHLLEQVISPVLWEKGIRALMEQEITQYFEIGPGKTLAGMNKKIGITAPMLSIEKVSDIGNIYEAIAR